MLGGLVLGGIEAGKLGRGLILLLPNMGEEKTDWT